MRIALHDAEKEHMKQKTFPNYALMKIAAYHKSIGDTVEWWNPLESYDRIYSSKVFDFTPENEYLPPDTIKGGTGYGMFGDLPPEIDSMFPDYSIYPECDYAIGYLTRGCPNHCSWCYVPRKEGSIKPYRSYSEIVRPDTNKLVLMDNNILACEHGISQLRELAQTDYRIDLNQGMDIRLLTDEVCSILKEIKWIKYIRFSCDSKSQLPYFERAVKLFDKYSIPKSKIFIYLLVRDDLDDAEERVRSLFTMNKNFNLYAQAERNEPLGIVPSKLQLEFTNRYIYSRCYKTETWYQYRERHNLKGNIKKMKWDGITQIEDVHTALDSLCNLPVRQMISRGDSAKELADYLRNNHGRSLHGSASPNRRFDIQCKPSHLILRHKDRSELFLTWMQVAKELITMKGTSSPLGKKSEEEHMTENQKKVIPLEELDLSVHAYNSFKRSGISTTADYDSFVQKQGGEQRVKLLLGKKVVGNYHEQLNAYMNRQQKQEKAQAPAMSFDLGAMLSAPAANAATQIQQIPCDMLVAYHNHKFQLYEGERLDDMVESIRENGVLVPIIVQPLSSGKYEILIGHNRWNASRLAGKPTVPAIVKTGLTEDEAEMYVIESNLMQRGFDNLRVSEQAAVLAARHSKMFSQGKRNDIIRELQLMEHPELVEQEEQKQTTSEKIGAEYGMSRNTVARLLRVDKLIDELKAWVDAGTLAIRAAVELSYLTRTEQEMLKAICFTPTMLNMKNAELLKTYSKAGTLTNSKMVEILCGTPDKAEKKPKPLKIRREVFGSYFADDTPQQEIEDTIEKALEFYFSMNRGDCTVC